MLIFYFKSSLLMPRENPKQISVELGIMHGWLRYTVKDYIFVGEKYCIFPFETFRMEFVVVNKQKSATNAELNAQDRMRKCLGNSTMPTTKPMVLLSRLKQTSDWRPLKFWYGVYFCTFFSLTKPMKLHSIREFFFQYVYFFFFCQYIFYKDGQIANRS